MQSQTANEAMFEYVDDDEFLSRLTLDSNSVMCVAPRGVTMHYRHPVAVLPDGFELKADIYDRAEKPTKLRPALVFMHDWTNNEHPKICGDRQCNFLALTAGIFCVALYYHQPRHGRYPAALKDLKTCLRWLRSIADTYAIDQEKIIAMGSSAGTQWTWLAAAECNSRPFDVGGEYEGFSSVVNLAVINAGICDFVKDFGDNWIGRAIMGGTAAELPAEYIAASSRLREDSGRDRNGGGSLSSCNTLLRRARDMRHERN